MKGYERQWLVVLVCVSLLTLFTANGLPLLDQDAGFGIKDDPAENQVLSLSERDAKEEDSSESTLSNVAGLAGNTATNTTANTTSTSARPGLQNATKSPKPLNTSGLNITANVLNTKNLTTTASPQNVSINATRTGNITLRLTSIQSSPVNINPSQTIRVVPKNSSGSSLSTYTNSLKPSLTRTPSESSIKLSAIGSPSVSLNPSKSATILTNPTNSVSSVLPTSVSSSSLLTQSATSLPSTQGPLQNTSMSAKNSTGLVSTQSPFGTSSPNNRTGIPSTQSLSGTPSAQGTSSAPSTKNPSTKGTTEASSTQKTQAYKSTKPASTKPLITTKLSTAQSTGVLSSLPPTTEVKMPESATKISTEASTRKPSTQASKKPSTKETSIAPSTKKVLSTIPNKPTTNAEVETTKKATTKKAITIKATTKKATTKKAVVSEKKTTVVKTKANNENNDEGKMPPPDQGKEAVLWDFIVPVAIGTGVALAIAFGVILVRTCRRRKLIKVRFGGKPSHPRLLNNDLINLLAESDDEEE